MKTEYNYNSEEIEWGGVLNEFLWTCAGANKKILRQCPTDYAKYAGIGGTILFTALMAMLSGGYALFAVFKNVTTAILFGVFWGTLIFNLDRFMVNTMYSDGKHTISRDELLGGLPRIILAVFLGIIISTPLEIRIFSDKIQSQLLVNKGNVSDEVKKAHETLYSREKDLLTQKRNKETRLVELKQGNVAGISGQIANKEKELSDAEDRLYEETNGTGITKKAGYGPAAKQLQDKVDRLKEELKGLRDKEQMENINNQSYIQSQIEEVQHDIIDLNRLLADVRAQIKKIELEGGAAQDALNGLTAQIQALNDIAGYGTDLFWARLCITLLFVSIEVIPTFFKMMIASGPYDDLLRSEMYKARVMSDKRISDINDEINTEIMISTEKNKNKLEAEVLANKELLNQIAQAQSELLSTAIEEWRKSELKKIEENPSAYIQTNTKSNEGQN